MQKFLILSVFGAFALVGCGRDISTKSPTTPIKTEHTKTKHTQGDKKESSVYMCEKGTRLSTRHARQDDILKLTVTAPTLQLKKQEIELKQVPAGSGERYINDVNPASIYEWHSNGHEGIFGVTVKGKTFEYHCQIKAAKKR